MRETPKTFDVVIQEKSSNELSFNVMPGKRVKETLHINEYRIAPNYIEGIFSRKYENDMLSSPSHLIFLSVLIHWQKLVYLYFCHHQGVNVSSFDDEKFKVWPTHLDIRLPDLVTDEENLTQSFWIDRIKKLPNGHWFIKGETRVQSISMKGDTIVMPV